MSNNEESLKKKERMKYYSKFNLELILKWN